MSINSISNGRRRAFRSRHKTSVGWGGKTAIIVVVLAILLFAVAVLIGNRLGDIAAGATDTADGSGAAEPGQLSPAPPVIARGVSPEEALGKTTDTTVNTENTTADATSASESGPDDSADATSRPEPPEYNGMSVILRGMSADGEYYLTYTTPTAAKCGFDTLGTCTPADLARGMKKNSDKARGVFTVSYQNAASGMRNVLREYELSLIDELFACGMDEIVICGFGESDSELTDAAGFIAELTERRPAAAGRIGVCLSFNFISKITESASDDASVVRRIRSLGLGDVFLALDLWHVDVPALMTPEEVIADRIGRCGDTMDRYSLRILVGCGTDAQTDPEVIRKMLDSQVSAAVSAGARSVQSVFVPVMTDAKTDNVIE